MSLVKQTQVDKIEAVTINDWKVMQVREATWIEEDGVTIGSKSYHRTVIHPTDDLSGQSAEVQAIASTVFTPEIISAYEAHKAAVEELEGN